MSSPIWNRLTGGNGGTAVFVDSLSENLSREGRKQIAQNLKDWLTNVARKKDVPDIDKRLEKWGKRFDSMAERCSFTVVDDEIVVRVANADSDTLRALKNGTDWFEPCDNVVNVMISALLKS